MKFEEIQTLIDKYFEGETSLDEERALKQYFSSGHADERFRPLLPLFDFIRAEQSVRIRQEPVVVHAPNRFAWKIMRIAAAVTLLLGAIAWWSYQPGNRTLQPVASVQPLAPAPVVVHENEAPPSMKQAEAPASLVKKQSDKKPKARFAHKKQPDTFKNPEEAAREIKAALELISSKIRKGQKEATKNIHAIEALDKIIKKPADS